MMWNRLDVGRMLVAMYAAYLSSHRYPGCREEKAFSQGFVSAIRALAIAFDLPQVAAAMSEVLSPDTIAVR